MLPFGNKNKKSKVQVLSRRVVERYTRKTQQGQLIEIYDDGNSKFDRVIDRLGDIEERGRVCLASDKSCTGTVKWIGRGHAGPGTEVHEEYYIVGVQLDSTRGAYHHQCSHGDLDGEIVVPSTTKNILFRGFPEWVPIKGQPPVSGMSAQGASVAKKSKDITECAEYTCDGLIRQSPQSKFDRFELDANGFHVSSRVKLDTGSVGTVRWIGCYHKKGVKLDDYIVGVELDSAKKEQTSLLTNGWYEGEHLVRTHKTNVKFTKLKNVCLLPTGSAAAKLNSQGTCKTERTLNGYEIEIYDDGKSTFDKVLNGIADIQYDDRVYLHPDKTKTGTVKWIGCGHSLASETGCKDFLVGVKMDKPEKDSVLLTDGMYRDQRLVDSKKKNIMFLQLKYWVLVESTGEKPKMVYGSKTQQEGSPKAEQTVDRKRVELYHDSQSVFDRVRYGIAGIQYDDRVYLYSDRTRTGTVKWIGCYHNHAYKTNSTDFLVGVEMDKPEKEVAKTLTDGMYSNEPLVISQKKNVVFTSVKNLTLIEPEVTEAKQSTFTTLQEIPIAVSDDDDESALASICCGARVQLYSNQDRIGTVKWLGIHHSSTSKTDQKDYVVGVEMENPDLEPDGSLTDGTYCEKRLVNSRKRNVVFANLQYCALADHANTKEETAKRMKSQLKERWSTVLTLEDTPIEIYHGSKSAFDRVRYGIAGIQYEDRVYVHSDKSRTGTVKWIGCDHGEASKKDPKDFLVGVVVDRPERQQRGVLTDGSYCREQLVSSQKRNVLFVKLQYCDLLKDSNSKPGMLNDTNSQVRDKRWSTVKALDGIPIEIYDDGKTAYDRVRYGIGGIKYEDRVQLCLDKTRTGTVKWIGCNHGQASNTDPREFLVGVEMDNPENESTDKLSDGTFCGDRLMDSHGWNIVFTEHMYCSIIQPDRTPQMANDPKTPPDEEWVTVSTVDGIPIEIYDDGKSAFDRVRYRIGGIMEGDKVYVYSDKTRTGTVKWIGCDHGLVSIKNPIDFPVGVEMEHPEAERPGVLTDGTWGIEQLVDTKRKNVIFTTLKFCSLIESERKPDTTGDTKTPPKDKRWSTVNTSDGIPIEIYHDSTSKYDRVPYIIAGIQEGDRVHLHSDKTRSGTVKWIGCDHGRAFEIDPKDFLVGVEVDNPEKERYEALTDGNYYGEQLVTSAERNVRFTKLKYWTLVDPERKPLTKGTKSQPNGTLKRETICNGYQIEFYHDDQSAFDRVCSGVAGIRDDDRVRLYSDKNITGTVKWIGCFHGTASETDHDDFFVGVQMDKPEDEYPSPPTDGTYYGERLVSSQDKNVVFTTLNYWALAEQTDMRPANTDVTRHHNERPPVHTKDPTLSPEIKKISDPNIYGNGSPMNKSTRGTVLLEVNVTAAPGHNQRDTDHSMNTANINSRQYPFGGRGQMTEDIDYEIPHSLVGENISIGSKKSFSRQNSTNTQMSLERQHSYDRQKYVDNDSRSSIQSVRSPQPLPRQPEKSIQPSDIPVQTPTLSQKPLSADMRIDLGPISKVKLSSKEVGNVFIENDPHKLLPDAKQKVASEIQKVKPTDISFKRNVRANTTTHETVRYATPQPTTAPVPVSSKSTNDYLPMDTEHFAEHDYSWTRDQFDAGFLLRGTATLQEDKTYNTVIVALKPSEKDLADESGEPLEDVVNEVVLPPTHPEQYNDFWKGVQGDLNSCYMDASMFAMFSYLTVFDDILYGKGATTNHSKGEDVKRTENVRQVLRTQIVNPLRKYGLAQKKGMHELRNLLDEWGLVKGLTGDEKDPEEFLNLLLVNTFATPSPIVLSNGQESHLFHLLAEKEEGMDFPTVQELVERTCLQENFKFSKIPPYLILHLPRFGKDFKMYEKIMPSLELDVTDVISGTSQSCYVCGAVATHECYGCYKDCYNISGSCFCNDCVVDYHRAPTRREHKPQKLIVADKDDGLATAKCVLKLAAVLCIETSHYVTFVASDTTAAARWYFFDSMADREGTTNIPQVREVPEFRKHLSEAKKSVDGVPPLIRRLVKDGYICFYTNPDVPQYYALGTPLNVTMPGGTTNL